MKLLKATVSNFASYKHLEFVFNSNGLTLISGPTGSGKSTLCDIVPWILFGKTSKGGAVDEVRSWDNDETTSGTLEMHGITITRTRKPNDLTIDGQRGKDLNDTQKMINTVIGMDYDLYLAGAYMHEFSQTAQFFTTTAKNRRILSEQLVDLSLAKNLSLTARDKHKFLHSSSDQIKAGINKLTAQLETMEDIYRDNGEKIKAWRKGINDDVREAIKMFRVSKANNERKTTLLHADITAINEHLANVKNEKCPTCGHETSDHDNIGQLRESKLVELSYCMKGIARDRMNLNSQIIMLRNMVNPFKREVDQYKMQALRSNLKAMAHSIGLVKGHIEEVEQLQELLPVFRNVLITDTISFLELKTNKLISEHFDGELSISLKIEEDDKLEVDIIKDGHLCAYTQLSKGQRQILKLTFCVAVMECIQNHHGIQMDTLFFDEALDGMDDEFKARAFTLLEKLSLKCDNIFVVEHNENLKLLFNNRIDVSLVDGNSVICLS
jgi:DNA repair exonuclease SbcCD ATPase subunit